MARASENQRESRSRGRHRRAIVAIALWLLAAFVVGAIFDVLLSGAPMHDARIPRGTLNAWFWEDDGNVRVSFDKLVPEDDPPSGWIIFCPVHTYYEPNGVFFRTRFSVSRSTHAYYDDERPDRIVPPERVDQWRPTIGDAMDRAGHPRELVEQVRRPDYHRAGWNLWLVLVNGLILTAPAWLVCIYRAAGMGPLPFTRRQRRQAKLRRGRCPDCGYDIRGLPQRRCPECGATWSADDAQTESTGL